MLYKILFLFIFLGLFGCTGEEEHHHTKSPRELTTYNVISYLNAHPQIDTSVVIIPDNYQNLISVKTIEKRLLEDWLKNHNEGKDKDSFLSIWSQFGDVLDLITLEFKIIQSLGLNPRIVFFKKETFYRDLDLNFVPFANENVFDVLQNQLLFAQDLIEKNTKEEIEGKMDKYFSYHSHFSKEDEEVLRFDLLRWYLLESEGFIRHKNNPNHDNQSADQ